MRTSNKIPRILKIESVKGFDVICIFNNGETRLIQFEPLFKKWSVEKKDPEFLLFDKKEFKKVTLQNQTLTWKNIQLELTDARGITQRHPYQVDPVVLYNESEPTGTPSRPFRLGTVIKNFRIKKGLTQQELATRSGTSKTYISRVENNLIEPEFSTLFKIVEIGLGRKVRIEIW